MKATQISINKTVGTGVMENGKEVGERKLVGKVAILLPEIQDVVSHFSKPESLQQNDKNEWTDSITAWIEKTIQAAAESLAKGRLVADSIEWKAGFSAWMNFAELCAQNEVERGQHFALAKEVAAGVYAHIKALGKSEQLASKISALLADIKLSGLKETLTANKNLVSKYLASYMATLNEGEQTKYETRFTQIVEAATVEAESFDDE